eukprot:COSAG04_NODE_14490_length_565_cov_1.884120_1_plen_69_part_01
MVWCYLLAAPELPPRVRRVPPRVIPNRRQTFVLEEPQPRSAVRLDEGEDGVVVGLAGGGGGGGGGEGRA